MQATTATFFCFPSCKEEIAKIVEKDSIEEWEEFIDNHEETSTSGTKMKKRIGNFLFFLGLILFTLAIVLLSGSVDSLLGFSVLVVSLVSLIFGRWLWLRSPDLTRKKPLSQQPAKIKMLAGIPAVVFILISLLVYKKLNLLGFLGLFLLAYAIVGLVEYKMDSRGSELTLKWDHIVGWKKFLVSTVVIGLSLIICGYAIHLFGNMFL